MLLLFILQQLENDGALALLKNRLQYLDSLSWEDKQLTLIEGILAGNVFDWGAKEVVQLMKSGLDFKEAAQHLQRKYTFS